MGFMVGLLLGTLFLFRVGNGEEKTTQFPPVSTTPKTENQEPRSLDIDKYISQDFHNKNNVYQLPLSSDTKKYISHEYQFPTHQSGFDADLTTPKTDYFDSKYKETVESVDQKLEHIDSHEFEPEQEQTKEVNLEELISATKSNETRADLSFINYTNIIRNDTATDKNNQKDLVVESGTNLEFISSFNHTILTDSNDTLTKEQPDASTISNAISEKDDSSTRKTIVNLTKPPTHRNVSHILSNNIETETVKAVKTDTKPSRGTVKFADYAGTTVPTIENVIDRKSEQLLQENQLVPVHVAAPVFDDNSTRNARADNTTRNNEETEINTTQQTTTTDNVNEATTIEKIDEATTVADIKEATTTDTNEETTTDSSEETTTAKIQAVATKDYVKEATTADITEAATTDNVEEATTTADITDAATIDNVEEATTTTENVKEATTQFSEESTLTTESVLLTTLKPIPEATVTTEVISTTVTGHTSLRSVSPETTTSPSTTLVVTELSPTTTAVAETTIELETTTAQPPTRVELETTTLKTTSGSTVVLETTTTVPVTEKQDEFRIGSDTKASIPEDTTDVTDSAEATSGTLGMDSNSPSGPNTGTIAAIVISCVAGVCLILLAALLYVMRKRQKRFNYGQRCRPVNLDDYSMDNVSVYNSSVRRKGARSSKRSYGNPAFEDPVSVTHPLNFPALSKFATNHEDIRAEFEEIPVITAKTNELPDGCDTKNRYANVIPLPETRVYLGLIDGYPTSDYINANYVTGPKNTKGYYIACQGPMQNTVDDFWRMLWEQQCRVVLMLTHFFENGAEKCVDYLPPSEVLDCHRLFGDFQVTLKRREVKEKYIISTVQLKNMVSNSWREVTHFWYLGWPEKGVPGEANSLIAFLIEARSYMKSASIDRKDLSLANGASDLNPVVVHCSPGTGRTGVVIACDIAIREFEQTRLVDIPKIVYRIRRDRASAVQSREQYAFIYKVVSLYATKLTGGVLDSL